MTKRSDVYTSLGHECGCCGYRHRTVREAGRCLKDYRRREYSDRIVVAVAAAPFPVVIEGETGTGKKLIARAIHEEGPRRGAVFVPVNCAVLGDELFESELFGHARGAFTGAAQDRKGLLELSSDGTVFVNEVAELTPRAQAKPLRGLQDGEIRCLGVVGLTAPPLRERGPDIGRLTEHCWKDIAAAAGSRATLARETVTALAAHPWPGNVRELQNVLANLTVTGPRYGPVGPDALPTAFRKAVAAERRPTLAEAREDVERAMVRDALGRHASVARAAGELGVTRQGLSKLLARLQVDRFDPTRDRSSHAPSR